MTNKLSNISSKNILEVLKSYPPTELEISLTKEDHFEAICYIRNHFGQWHDPIMMNKDSNTKYTYDLIKKIMEKVTHEYYKDEPDGIDLYYNYIKQKENEPKGLIVCFHGYGACTDRECSSVANYFGEKGYDVVGFDQEGHGKTAKKETWEESPAQNNEKRPPLNTKGFKSMMLNGIQFIKMFLKENEERYKDKKVFLWGQSMGGGLVLSIAIHLTIVGDEEKELNEKIKGLVVAAPAIILKDKPNWFLYSVLVMASYFFPSKTISDVDSDLDKPMKATRIPEFQNGFMKDPYCKGGPPKIKSAKELISMGNFILKNINKINKPFLVVHGGDDDVVKVEGSKKLFDETVNVKDKTFIVFKDGWHAINSDYTGKKANIYYEHWVSSRI